MDEYERNERAERLRRDLDNRRIAFLDTDLDVALKSVGRAVTELSLGHRDRADELFLAARDIHKGVAKFLPEVDDLEQRERLWDKHQRLAVAIQNLERRGQEP